MSVQKTPNGRWIARYRAPDGKVRSKTWDRKTDAERWRREELGRRDRGEWVDPKLGKTRFGEWAVTVMGARLHTRASTRARDRSVLDSLVMPTFSGFELRRITPADIQAWVSKLVAAGYAAETVHKAHALLRMILTAAVDSDLLARSPARGVKLPRIERREMRFLTPEELSELLEAVPDRYRLLVKTAAYTGLRFGELAGLRPRDVEPLRKKIMVRRGLVEVSGRLHVEEPKTPASRRTVKIPAWLGEELAFHLAGTDALYVFTAPRAGPLRRSGFRSRVWVPATVQAGLKGLRFHDLRHTHAAWLVGAGEHPKTIQGRLGHASISTTLDTYGHLMDGLDEAAAEALPRLPAHSPRAEVVELHP